MEQRKGRKVAPFKYYGGKFRLAKKIIPYVDDEEQRYSIYVEPFAGAANVFWQKKRHRIEVLNDKALRITSVLRCLQEPDKCKRLVRRLKYTAYSRAEFIKALEILNTSKNEEELAWAVMVAYGQCFGGNPQTQGNWRFTSTFAKGLPEAVSAYYGKIEQIEFFHKRLRGVYLECSDALYVLKKYDTPKTVFYLDPPYVPDTRWIGNEGKCYAEDMTREEHKRLIKTICELKGKVVLSGYDNDIYQCLDKLGWKRVEFPVNYAYGKSGSRTECLWINKR